MNNHAWMTRLDDGLYDGLEPVADGPATPAVSADGSAISADGQATPVDGPVALAGGPTASADGPATPVAPAGGAAASVGGGVAVRGGRPVEQCPQVRGLGGAEPGEDVVGAPEAVVAAGGVPEAVEGPPEHPQ